MSGVVVTGVRAPGRSPWRAGHVGVREYVLVFSEFGSCVCACVGLAGSGPGPGMASWPR
jgi:hypothetical protein